MRLIRSAFSIRLLPRKLSFLTSFLGQVKVAWRFLLILIVGVFFPFLLFERLAVAIGKSTEGLPWDVSILLAIHRFTQESLDVFAAVITQLGTFWGSGLLAAMVALVLWQQRRERRSLLYLLTTVLGSALINYSAKLFLHRVRPHLWELTYPLPADYAFPSGHAMSSMTLVATLVILAWGSRWFWLVLATGSIFVVVIGWTRLYLGVHFPSDILAGWMLSLSWTLGISLLIKPHLTQAIALDEEAIKHEQKITESLIE